MSLMTFSNGVLSGTTKQHYRIRVIYIYDSDAQIATHKRDVEQKKRTFLSVTLWSHFKHAYMINDC
jgi:hypothetical protein